MDKKSRKLPIAELFAALRHARDTGFYPKDFPLTPKEVEEQLREIKPQLIEIREMFERMEVNPQECAERTTEAMRLIQIDYPKETSFLNKIVNEKLGSSEFTDRVVTLFCDLSNAQAGLVEPERAFLLVSRYVDMLELVRGDPDLSQEMERVLS